MNLRAFLSAISLASIVSAAFAQPAPEGLPLTPLIPGQALFSDNSKFVFQDIPPSLQGKTFLKTSFRNGASFVIRGEGYISVITAQSGHASSQAPGLLSQGFSPAPFGYSLSIWQGLPKGLALQLMQKKVSDGETIHLGMWGVPVFSAAPLSESATAPCAQATPASPAALIPAPRPDKWWQERHQKTLEQVRSGTTFDLVLVGDSITQRWEEDGKDIYTQITGRFSTLNLGYSGDRTQHVLWRLNNGEIDGVHPKKLVLLIGTNNLPAGRSTPEETLAGVDAVLSLLQSRLPETKILVMSLFPRGQGSSDPVQGSVEKVNASLAAMAEKHKCKYLDINSRFIDPATGAPQLALFPDRLHPNSAGYQIWIDALQPFLSE